MKSGDPTLQRPSMSVGSVTKSQISWRDYCEELESEGVRSSHLDDRGLMGDNSAEAHPAEVYLYRVTPNPPFEQKRIDCFVETISQPHSSGSRIVVGSTIVEDTDDANQRKLPGDRARHARDRSYFVGRTPEGWDYRHRLVACPNEYFFPQDRVVTETSLVQDLKPGDPLLWEYAYRPGTWKNGERALVNGTLYPIPIVRPEGIDWKLWPSESGLFKSVSSADWKHLTKAVDGHFLDEVLPQGTLDTDNRLNFIKRRISELRNPQKKTKASTPKTGCFHGYKGTEISFGRGKSARVMWSLKGEGPVFVVDCAGIGALYIFRALEPAREWAGRELDFRDARKQVQHCIVHTPGWEERTRACLAEFGVR